MTHRYQKILVTVSGLAGSILISIFCTPCFAVSTDFNETPVLPSVEWTKLLNPNDSSTQLHVLIFYKSDSETRAHTFEANFNQSLPVDLWDIKVNPFPIDPAFLRTFSLVILDVGINSGHLNSDQKETIWSALNDGASFLFNYANTKIYYDKFGVTGSWNKTNHIWLNHNHPVLAPNFLYSAGTSWHTSEASIQNFTYFYMNGSSLPSDHKILLHCNNSKGETSFPYVIYGKHGKGKFAVITGKMGSGNPLQLGSYDIWGIPWVYSRVVYWLLPDEQPLRHHWSYLSIAFRDDDLGGNWAGNLQNQVDNMSMVLSWGVPITWSFACEESSREIWSDPEFVAKLKELEDAGHELFLHAAGYKSHWQGYNYSMARARIEELMENYEEILGHPPRGWVTSQHGYTETIIQVLEDLGFKYSSENRKQIGTILLNDTVWDVSVRVPPPLNLNAYKDYTDHAWLFGPRILCFYTHFCFGNLKVIDQWISDFKEFVSNYPHRWLTLDELAHTVHGQPHLEFGQIVSDGNTIKLKASSTVETTLFLELRNSTISNAIVNGISVHFRSKNALMIRVHRETEVVINIGTPKEDVRVTYSDNPPVEINLVQQELAVSFLVSRGRNVTVQINIPYDDGWNVNCTEPSWGKEWNSTTRILTAWAVSDGFFTVAVFGIEDRISPVANAGSDHTIYEETLVIFDGSRSYDNVGITSYRWSFVDVTLKTLTGMQPNHTFNNVGDFEVTLNVSDYAGNWDTDTMWVHFLTDISKPSIGTVSQEPEIPDHGEKVTVTVGVTDEETGVHNVTLWYSLDDGETYTCVKMEKTTGDTYEGEIPGLPVGTNIKYKIIATDNAGNFEVDDQLGQSYAYTVIPEFPTWTTILLTLIIITVTIATHKRRLPARAKSGSS